MADRAGLSVYQRQGETAKGGLTLSSKIKRGDCITVGGMYEHIVDRVTDHVYREGFQARFRIGLKIRNGTKNYSQYIYCTADQSVQELGIKDGDGIIITRIKRISFSAFKGATSMFMNVDIIVKPQAASEDYLEGGYPVVEDENYPAAEDATDVEDEVTS